MREIGRRRPTPLAVLWFTGCAAPAEPPPPPPPPLPARSNISGAYDARLAGTGAGWRFIITDADGTLTGAYFIRSSPTAEFQRAGDLVGSAVQRTARSRKDPTR